MNLSSALPVLGAVALIILLLWLLYTAGLISLHFKRAAMFSGSISAKQATFDRCSGYTKRVIRFSEARVYTFTLEGFLRRGLLTFDLLDPARKCVLHLDASQPTGSFKAEAKVRYTFIIRFQQATGKYVLNWE